MKELLKVRKVVKSSKPKNFLRTDANRKIYKNKWRKPRGLHNKRRLNKKGHQKNPSQGYRSPVLVRGLNKKGMNEIVVSSVKDFQKVDPKKDIAVISRKVGLKGKLALLAEVKNTNIKIKGIPHPEKFILQKNEEIKLRKEASKKKQQKKETTKKEAIKKAEEKTKKPKEEGKDKQEKVKEEVMHAQKKAPETTKLPKKEAVDTKLSHKQSTLPGDRK